MRALLAAPLAALALAGGSPPRWTVTDLGTPPAQPGAFMNAVAINGHGEVLGTALVGSYLHHRQEAFTWQNGRFTMLTYRQSTWLQVTGINDRGTVIGAADDSGGAVVWEHGKVLAIGTLGGKPTSAVAVNDRDQVVGTTIVPDGQGRAFLWQHGRITDLGTLGGAASQAIAVNDRGQVVGTSTTADGMTHAFLWQNGTMTDLGSLPGVDSYPTAIDESGEIVGGTREQDNPWNPIDAVVWRGGRLIDLGRFGARGAAAVAVNDLGHVLVALDGRDGDQDAALLLRGAKQVRIRDLGASAPPDQGPSLLTTRLNDRDQVLGFGYRPNGARRLFIWQNGVTTILPTFDGVDPPWGFPVGLNDSGDAVGMTYRSLGSRNAQHIAVWRPVRVR